MHIDGTTRVYAVIGDPVTAVRSPEWFNTLFEKSGSQCRTHTLAGPAGRSRRGIRRIQDDGKS